MSGHFENTATPNTPAPNTPAPNTPAPNTGSTAPPVRHHEAGVDAAVEAVEAATASAAPRRGLARFVQPVPTDRRPRRFAQLMVGLVLYGFSLSLMVRAALGLDPWDVFHQGLTSKVPFSFGTVIIATSFVVLLLWIPIRQRPGLGTLANAVVVGAVTDLGLSIIPTIDTLALQISLMVAAVLLNALAGALYIGAGLGPGPRDGLMTGLVARGVGSVALVRTGLEGTVLVFGWILGGAIGVGTVLYAFGIGPLLQVLLPRFALNRPERSPVGVPGAPRRR